MDLTTMTPAEIDALWFPLQEAEDLAEARVTQYERAAEQARMDYQREQYATTANHYREVAAQARIEQAPFAAEWARRGGWTRAYLAVTNGNGHVHSSMNCSTCNREGKRTAFARLAEVSGLDLAEIIDLAGERACTTCYTGAPVSALQQATRLFSKDEIKAKAEREAKAAKLAEKKAKAAAAAITNPDGSTLTGPLGKWDEIKTERTAWNTAVEITFNHRAHGYDQHLETFFRIITALAAKTGRSFESIHEEVEAKAQAKAKREHVTI
jgi:hypothetical protein